MSKYLWQNYMFEFKLPSIQVDNLVENRNNLLNKCIMDYRRSGDILQSFHTEMAHMGSLFLAPDQYVVALNNI